MFSSSALSSVLTLDPHPSSSLEYCSVHHRTGAIRLRYTHLLRTTPVVEATVTLCAMERGVAQERGIAF
ncbi:hypothetical protein Y032_0168g199 [Ancylostoma ceylanicum]|uniref:Uncharacterized protein n=1 Tax=Ancylostoma ceylanicum TaxID=53326 RepID=A0A016SW33_9BILA|nr:hypothetical protein Y032_0168g199 [Ancylostoma ceylanicum]